MAEEPESLVLQLLRNLRAEIGDMRSDIADIRGEMATKDDISEVKSRIADVAADLITTRREISEQIVGLRRAVMEYHTSTIGHGILISELEARLRKVEQHLNIEPPEAH